MGAEVRITQKICYRTENTNSAGAGTFIKLQDRFGGTGVAVFPRYSFF